MMVIPFAQVACYGIVTIIFLIVTVNMEYHIIGLIARDFAFQISIVSAEFGSSRFCCQLQLVSLHECCSR